MKTPSRYWHCECWLLACLALLSAGCDRKWFSSGEEPTPASAPAEEETDQPGEPVYAGGRADVPAPEDGTPLTDMASPPATTQTQTPKDPEQALQALRVEYLLQKEEMKELRERDAQVTAEVNQLRFVNTQLRDQIRALVHAAEQRDELRKKLIAAGIDPNS